MFENNVTKKAIVRNDDSSNYSFGFAHREEVARSETKLLPSKNQYGDKISNVK